MSNPNKPVNIMDELLNLTRNHIDDEEKVFNFLNDNPDIQHLLLAKDEESIVNQIKHLENKLKNNNMEGYVKMFLLRMFFQIIAKDYHGDKRQLMLSLYTLQNESITQKIIIDKTRAAMRRNIDERYWIIEQLDRVMKLPNYDGCQFRGKFSKNKFVDKYTPLVNEKFGKNITSKTTRAWINKFLKDI